MIIMRYVENCHQTFQQSVPLCHQHEACISSRASADDDSFAQKCIFNKNVPLLNS